MRLHKGYVAIIVLTVLLLLFHPGVWLMHKPANSGNEHYAKGWADGCLSGANSNSAFYAFFLDKPFVREIGDEGNAVLQTTASADKSKATPSRAIYNDAWNEGYTVCRFYQAAGSEMLQFIILIATLLVIGLRLERRKGE